MLFRSSGSHETTIREYSLGPAGLKVGEPLTEFQGVLSGIPTFQGSEHLLEVEPKK